MGQRPDREVPREGEPKSREYLVHAYAAIQSREQKFKLGNAKPGYRGRVSCKKYMKIHDLMGPDRATRNFCLNFHHMACVSPRFLPY
jgi:hypothetical protein